MYHSVAGSDQQAAALTFRMWSHAFCAGALNASGEAVCARRAVRLFAALATAAAQSGLIRLDPTRRPRTIIDAMTSRARFFEPMLCRAVNELPQGQAWSLDRSRAEPMD